VSAIVVFEKEDPEQPSAPRAHNAVAVMARTLAMAAEPISSPTKRKRAQAEKTRKGNPNRLTIKQHVFPLKSIERFFDEAGRVAVRDVHRSKTIRLKPDNPIFCAARAWNESTEAGFMKRIEDAFQRAVDPIVAGATDTIAAEDKGIIDRSYALWHMRARFRVLESEVVALNGLIGSMLTKAQEENLEKNGYIFARKDGTMPARHLNGVQLRMRVDHFALELANTVTRWGVITPQSGEFIVPDVPSHGIIPLSPKLALAKSSPDGMIRESNLAEINRSLRDLSEAYYFARDLAACPL
jgi:hypothetical protein